MKTLITVSMVIDWPEEELAELAAKLDAGAREGMLANIAPIALKHGATLEEVDELLAEHFEFYGVQLMPRQEVSVA